MRRFLAITLLLVGFCGLAMAEDQSRISSEMLRPWKLAFIRDNNIWVAEADGSGQRPVTSQWKKDDPKRSSRFSDGSIVIAWHPKKGYLTFSHPETFKADRLDGTAGMVPAQKTAKAVIAGSTIFDARLSETEPVQATVRFDLFEGGTGFYFADHAHPAWSPSGEKLAFTRNGDIWIAEMKNGSGAEPPIGWEVKRLAAVASYDEPTFRASRNNRGATRLSWHPNERLLAYGYDRLQGSGFNEIHLYDTRSGKNSVLMKDALDPCFSPDGRFIVYWNGQCAKGISTCIWAVSSDGKNKRKLVANGKNPVW
jgi:hypothetical protein